MSSPGYWGAGSADLSTVDPNPGVYGYADTGMAQDISSLGNTVGQWGATIASIVTGNPVATVGTPSGPRAIGAAGSTYNRPGYVMGIQSSTLVLVAIVAVVVWFVTRED